ncbi:uncharacterized protein F4807DRAFT_460323 [Annulohypoxylon truncatum]|uniref:uncharacterized protein n=1 Tax=Annulohypoxylon truncatum TaxID=327061 RepID=UPI0020072E65|nr:uncharacterized protein F4807DRAFT_460323 [Annulohypoxylon truncatum]KAI1210036.1 hypothetical protein F4807DRAFT_460323 [Annulohypoxylon truncatum]
MAPSAKSSEAMPFIISTGTKERDPESRKLIRSHVMKGRNRGRILRPKYKNTVELEVVVDTNENIQNLDSEGSWSLVVPEYPTIIPQRVGSDISLIRFADKIDKPTIGIIIEFSTIAKKALFPLESCINFGPKTRAWMEDLTVDAAYLHAMAFSAQGYFDLRCGRVPSNSSSLMDPHVVKTLRLLRESLEMVDRGDMTELPSRTAAIVLCLAFHAHMTGDFRAARHHIVGLRGIVDLAGGLVALKDNTKVMVEILRCDIGMALHSGTQPLFFSDLAREPYWPYPDFSEYASDPAWPLLGNVKDEPFLGLLDADIATAWRVTKRFTMLVNYAAETQNKLPKEYLLDTMASVTYRLLHKSSLFPRSSLNEAMRLGILVFGSGIFLQWAGVQLPYTHFPAAYRDCLVNLNLKSLDLALSTFTPAVGDDGSSSTSSGVDSPPPLWSSQLLLWLLTIGHVSVFDSTDSDTWLKPWLRVNLDLCGIRTWSAMRDVLSSFIWVGIVHDMPGKSLFNSTMSTSSHS